MNRLTKGMYGHEFAPRGGLFGLSCGQMRCPDVVHNGGWYNHLGEKLGWGDLSPDDLNRIAAELKDDEVFIILGEYQSHWDFVKQFDSQKRVQRAEPTAEAPGTDYVADKCFLVITRGRIAYVNPGYERAPLVDFGRGPTVPVITRTEARDLILGYARAA
jgi:hypothetical protein